jgi:hypothetical protein
MSSVTPLDLDRLSPRQRSRLAGEVVATYLRVRWQMRNTEPESAVRALRERAGLSGGNARFETGEELVAAWRLARATRRVLTRLPADSRCLFRSLTLMCMLERRGISQTVVIAVRPKPFAAHAWVEVEGTPVLSDADPGFERLLEL